METLLSVTAVRVAGRFPSLEKLSDLDFDVMCGGHGSPLEGNASEKLRQLMKAWGDLLLKGIPGRLSREQSLSGED